MKKLATLKEYLSDALTTLRSEGLRQTWKKFGWRLAALIFIYYLIRDTLLYLVIPGLIVAFASS